MVNLTVSIPEDLCKKMKRHSEVKWSEVVRKALAEYVSKMEIVEGGSVSSEKLASMLKDANLDTEKISLQKAEENYEKRRELERKRLSTKTS
jgi:metal-responsive CopG/Arc/MetJ family transcriptional regulator